MSKMTPFVYRPRTEEQMRRRIEAGKWADWIYSAYKDDTRGLCDYLRSPDLPLDASKRSELADFIEERIQRRQRRGRRPGVLPSFPGKITTREVVKEARRRLKWVKAHNGGRVPRGSYKQVLEEVCRSFGDEGHNVDIDFDKALDDLRRGAAKRSVKRR